MKRRKFLVQLPATGAVLGAGLSMGCRGSDTHNNLFEHQPMMNKVILAMLSIQRATWEQGVAMQSLLEHGEKELVILMAKNAVIRQWDDGRMAMLGEDHPLTDAASPGEAVLWAARETGDEDLMNGHRKLLDYLLHKAPRTADGILFHFTNSRQLWSDSNYMLPPYLAAAGEYDEALKQIEGLRRYLWNGEKQLFAHMWNYETGKFAREDFWGVGNGWTAAGYIRVLEKLPSGMKAGRDKLTGYLKTLLDGCIRYMRSDGLFHNIIDRPDTFVETNLSQQLAYTIYKATRLGYLEKEYRDVADTMRASALNKVDHLGLVQGVCGSPEFDHPGIAAEGQAFHILMETAYHALQ